MKSLLDVISDPAARTRVVNETVNLIDHEVHNKSGLTGLAIKGGYAAVKNLKGGRMIPAVVDGLLPEFCSAIEPLHKEYRDSGNTGGFAGFLRTRGPQAAAALLRITDGRAQRTDNQVLRKAYEKLRPMGEKSVIEALPQVASLVDKFCA